MEYLVFGIAGALLGILFLYWSNLERSRLEKILAAGVSKISDLTGPVEKSGCLVEINGSIRSEKPLQAPYSNRECVYYFSKTEEKLEKFTRRDGSAVVPTIQHRTTDEKVHMTSFQVDDGSGCIWVSPEGAKIVPCAVIDRFDEKTQDEGGILAGVARMIGIEGTERVLGHSRKEEILPIGQQVYILGELDTSGGTPRVKKPSSITDDFLISVRSGEDVVASAKKRGATFFRLGLIFFVAGVALTIFSFAY